MKKIQVFRIPGFKGKKQPAHKIRIQDEQGSTLAEGYGSYQIDGTRGRTTDDGRRVAVYLARYALDECGCDVTEGNTHIANSMDYSFERSVRRVLRQKKTVALIEDCTAIVGFDGETPNIKTLAAAYLLEPGYRRTGEMLHGQGWYWKPWEKVARYGRLTAKP